MKELSKKYIQDLKVKVARQVKEMNKFDIVQIADYMGKTVPKEFTRKRFRDFNYINIEPTTKAIIVTYILTILLSIGLAIFSVKNDIED